MTSETAALITRIGLVLDAISVFLLAPEILGAQRLKRFREFLGKFMKGIYRWSHWYSPFMWDKNLEARLPRNATGLSWTTRIFVILIVALCPLATSFVIVYSRWIQAKAFWIQLVVWGVSFLLSSIIGFFLLTYVGGFALGTIERLSSNERLRTTLFGFGVVLFIAGFAFQFLGTF